MTNTSQIIAFAGDGKLGQGKPSSREFREYLSLVTSDFLERYIAECLSSRFDNSGYALQDLINEVGHRLGFDVTFGRYRGSQGQNGFDGIWKSAPEGTSIIVEVKTTDTYAMNLNAIAGYRRMLIQERQTTEESSSVLIVVGREDTGGLEAQIRGSRHARDIRLISTTSLLRLLRLKENLEDPSIVYKIRSILTPQEFTKVDGIVDIVFLTAEDVSNTTLVINSQDDDDLQIEQIGIGSSPTVIPRSKRIEQNKSDRQKLTANFTDSCIENVESHLGKSLVKASRTTYEDQSRGVIVGCFVSKEYDHGKYWFSVHRHHDEAMAKVPQGFLAFGCGAAQNTILVPYHEFAKWQGDLNMTSTEKSYYWHIRVIHEDNRWFLRRKAGKDRLDISQFLLP